MTVASLTLAVVLASQPLAIWSASDTSLGQEVRAAFERAIEASARVHAVNSPQGAAPSLLVDQMQLTGTRVTLRVTIFAGQPHRSEEIWSRSETCAHEELDRCAAEIIEHLPAFSEG